MASLESRCEDAAQIENMVRKTFVSRSLQRPDRRFPCKQLGPCRKTWVLWMIATTYLLLMGLGLGFVRYFTIVRRLHEAKRLKSFLRSTQTQPSLGDDNARTPSWSTQTSGGSEIPIRRKPQARANEELWTKIEGIRIARELRLAEEQRFIQQSLPETRENVRRIRERFDNSTLVVVKGFFSSGTNWLRSLFSANCPNMKWSIPLESPYPRHSRLDADGLYGWKHGFFLEKEIEAFKASKHHSIVILSREAPTWLVSAWKMNAMVPTPSTYRPPPPQRVSLTRVGTERFRSTINTVKPAPPQTPQFSGLSEYVTDWAVNESGVPPGLFFEKYYDMEIRPQYSLVAPTPLEARTKVYQSWMALLRNPEIASRIRFLRYEDLREHPFQLLTDLQNEFNLPCNLSEESRFNPVSTRVKMGMQDPSALPQQSHPREEFCRTFNSQALYTDILKRIDRDFEREVLGYEYPDSLSEYCAGVQLSESTEA